MCSWVSQWNLHIVSNIFIDFFNKIDMKLKINKCLPSYMCTIRTYMSCPCMSIVYIYVRRPPTTTVEYNTRIDIRKVDKDSRRELFRRASCLFLVGLSRPTVFQKSPRGHTHQSWKTAALAACWPLGVWCGGGGGSLAPILHTIRTEPSLCDCLSPACLWSLSSSCSPWQGFCIFWLTSPEKNLSSHTKPDDPCLLNDATDLCRTAAIKSQTHTLSLCLISKVKRGSFVDLAMEGWLSILIRVSIYIHTYILVSVGA